MTLTLGCQARAQAPAEPSFAFPLPWDDAAKTAVDVSAWNPAPLTEKNRVGLKNGKFVDATGKRVRFIGMNVGASLCFVDHKTAEKIAAHLHKFGVNLVRLHHMDAPWSQPNLFYKNGSYNKPTDITFDKDNLEKLDYLISQFKKHGIYVNLNLHVTRQWGSEDGFPDTDKIHQEGKIVSYFEPKAIELQKKYARQLLGHKNPYLNARYADDPVLALVEITNEDSLIGGIGEVASYPEHYKSILGKGWNAFLKQKYSTTAALTAAWKGGGATLGPNLIPNPRFASNADGWSKEAQGEASYDASVVSVAGQTNAPEGRAVLLSNLKTDKTDWHLQYHAVGLDLKRGERYTVTFAAKSSGPRGLGVNTRFDRAPWSFVGLDKTVALTPEWKRYSMTFTASDPDPNHTRLSFVLGGAQGDVYLADVRLSEGGGTEGRTLEPGQSLDAGTIPFGEIGDGPAGADWVAYLIGVEKSFTDQLSAVIKSELKVRAPVTCSQGSYGGLGGLLRESRMDWIDMHSYWQHPSFPGNPFDLNDYQIENTPMVSAKGLGALLGLTRHRVKGKPHTISEYDHPAPSEWAAEMVPMIFAHAARQDWDGIDLFAFGEPSDKITSFFDSSNHPGKLGFLPAAAAMFLQGDVPPLNATMTLTLPAAQVPALAGKSSSSGFHGTSDFWGASESPVPPGAYETHRVEVAFSPTASKPTLTLSGTPAPHPVSWNPDASLFTVAGKNSQAIVGLVGGKSVTAGILSARFAPSQRNFAAMTLSITPSGSRLLTVIDKAENPGLVWNATRKSATSSWSGPVQVWGVAASVTVAWPEKSAQVWILDNTGKRMKKLGAKLVGGKLSFAISPADKTIWYELAR